MLIDPREKKKPAPSAITKARIRLVISVTAPLVAPPHPIRTTHATIMREPRILYFVYF